VRLQAVITLQSLQVPNTRGQMVPIFGNVLRPFIYDSLLNIVDGNRGLITSSGHGQLIQYNKVKLGYDLASRNFIG